MQLQQNGVNFNFPIFRYDKAWKMLGLSLELVGSILTKAYSTA